MRRRRGMMRRRRRWRGGEGIRRICRTACWWRRALVSFPCISCYKVVSAKKKLNNHIVEMDKDPSSCIPCYTTFERRTFFLGTALCISIIIHLQILWKCLLQGKKRERKRVHLWNVGDKDFKSLPMHNQHRLGKNKLNELRGVQFKKRLSA